MGWTKFHVHVARQQVAHFGSAIGPPFAGDGSPDGLVASVELLPMLADAKDAGGWGDTWSLPAGGAGRVVDVEDATVAVHARFPGWRQWVLLVGQHTARTFGYRGKARAGEMTSGGGCGCLTLAVLADLGGAQDVVVVELLGQWNDVGTTDFR